MRAKSASDCSWPDTPRPRDATRDVVSDAPAVIVGAGPAGLAVAACLGRAGVPFVLLEQSPSIGSRWRSRYDRLHLHTAKEYSALPYLPYPAAYPRYPSRDQVVEYLERYRAHFAIDARLGERVTRVARSGGDWVVTTSATSYRTRNVILCTGRSDIPYRARWQGDDHFPGRILHSAEYANGASFAGQRVLVIGIGNSGAEIAIDLVEHGARPDISIRSAVNVVPRDFLGRPIQRTSILISPLPLRVRDAIGRFTSRLVFGDLTKLGMPRATEGPVSQIARRGRIPVIDVGTVALVRARRIGVRGDVQRLEGDRVVFADGTAERFDALVLATGYRTGLAQLSAEIAGVLGPSGVPAGVTDAALPGIFFVGYQTPPTGLLRQIALDAERAARLIAAGA